MRTALDWIIEEDKTETALQFVNDLFEFWLRHSDYEEARQWHARILALPDAQQYPETYLEAFNHLTWVYWLQTKMEKARTSAEHALILSQSQTSKVNMAVAHLNLGLTLMTYKEYEKAQGYLEEAEDISQENLFEWELARAHLLLGAGYKDQDQYASAQSHFAQALHIWKKLGDIGFQCVLPRFAGDLEFKQGNLNEAVNEYCESLLFARIVKNRWISAGVMWGLARVAKAKGHHDRALRLYWASKKIYDDIGAWWSSDDLEVEEELAGVRIGLGEAETLSVLEDGQRMTMEESIEFALGEGLN